MRKNKTILVVEDEPFLCDIYKRQLETRGCRVHVTFEGKQALKAVQDANPDIILLDLIMPVMNGFEFLEALRVTPSGKKCRVVVLTNLGQENDRERCKKLGVKEYYVKTQVGIDEVISNILG